MSEQSRQSELVCLLEIQTGKNCLKLRARLSLRHSFYFIVSPALIRR